MNHRRRATLQQYELTKAKSWKDPVMVKRFIVAAQTFRPLTEMQWYRLSVIHGFDLIRQIKLVLGVNHD